MALIIALSATASIETTASGQELTGSQRGRGKLMLKAVKKEIQKNYYDSTFHGLDLEARFQKAEQDLESATSFGHMFGIIAQAVLDLGDSHTMFVPPRRTARYHYGWQMQVIGETPYVIAVKPGSDAEVKGLKCGDAVLSIDGFPPSRQNLSIMRYLYYTIRPAPGMRLVVQSPGGQRRQLDIMAKVTQSKRVLDFTQGEDIWDLVHEMENTAEKYRFIESKDKAVFMLNLPSFNIGGDQLNDIAGRLRKCQSAVLDLRRNPGGYLEMVCRLLGCFFDQDITIAQPRGRKEKMDPLIAKSRGREAFSGKLIVIVDSDSGSAAELFARIVQLKKRGTVVGDRTAGGVMQSRYRALQTGTETLILYGILISEAELIMPDGNSLEKVGVTPDVISLPTGADLAAGLDPVLALAAGLAGAPILPKDAGMIFPVKWID